jgi:hypothetical protein
MAHSKSTRSGHETHKTRYVIWRQESKRRDVTPIDVMLSRFPNVEVVRTSADSAVVRMDAETAGEVRTALPDCVVETDVPFRLAR